ncbi:hypothetical protein C5167_031798 [Papaver somniferum]|uniref:Uncharacterized protein n=1 Tax=Papaver somniferum TaxID=3469 RepID=A0A4Y7K5C8_PAPSO|nr:hypothetical protein C5167_031798 [Papaver somniferum]
MLVASVGSSQDLCLSSHNTGFITIEKGINQKRCFDSGKGDWRGIAHNAVSRTHTQVRYEEIMSDSAYFGRDLVDRATKAADIADAALNNVYQAMGFLQR